ncbi:acetyltransferase [Devosia pacifica]|uniref:Acetyltransferase n=1 Tax=Devosia pacifica TaxID=1335967 RepID=A0A918VRL7_9HYPH|nr:GNAT family N-acetyltransferase [Devosia pacifica]GHA16646.1 acetyltransferase [Devosia pacifica]
MLKTSTDLPIRRATIADLEAVLALSDAGNANGPIEPDPVAYRDPRYSAAFEAIAAHPDHDLFVVEHEGEVVGTFQLSIIPGLPRFGMTRGLLENVHVRADQRGTGIGTKMMEWAIAHCRERGCGLVQLTSNKVRKDAHRFYQRLGFEASHEGFKLML